MTVRKESIPLLIPVDIQNKLKELTATTHDEKAEKMLRCVESVTIFHGIDKPMIEDYERRDIQRNILKTLLHDSRKLHNSLLTLKEGMEKSPIDYREIIRYLRDTPDNPDLLKKIDDKFPHVPISELPSAYTDQYKKGPLDLMNKLKAFFTILDYLEHAQFHLERMSKNLFPAGRPKEEARNILIYFLTLIFNRYHKWEDETSDFLADYRLFFVQYALPLAHREYKITFFERHKRLIDKANRECDKYLELIFWEGSPWPMKSICFPRNYDFNA